MAARGRTLGEELAAAVRPFLPLWRYFITGQSVLGRPTDNATFLHAATADLRGGPVEKLSGPRWHRVARRWAVLGVPLLLLGISVVAAFVRAVSPVDPAWSLLHWRDMAIRYWIVGTLAVTGYGIYRSVQFLRYREQNEDFVYPAWEAACDAMGYKYRRADASSHVFLPDGFDAPDVEKPPSWVTARFHRWRDARRADEAPEEDTDAEPSGVLVPVSAGAELETYKPYPLARLLPRRRVQPAPDGDEDDLGDPVEITLISGKCSTVAEQNRFKQKVGPVLGMPDAKAKFYLKGRRPHAKLWLNHQPPPEFTFAEFRRYLDHPDIDINHIPIGLSHNNRLEFINFKGDTAHLLVSAESGRGKSNFIKVAVPILMHLGAEVVVLDRKLISHRWAHDLPGCTYASELESTDDEPGIHELLVLIGAEIKRRRKSALPAVRDVDTPLNKFPTLIILVEEQNILSEELRDYWSAIRKPRDPAQSPAFTALRGAIYTGREFGIRVISVAQMATAMTFGANGGAARESFSTRVMGGWTPQAWKMLARGIPFMLCPPGAGIFSVIQSDGRAPIVRAPLITDREARDLAMSGVPSLGQPLGNVVVIDGDDGTVVEQITPTEPLEPELVTLREAADGNMLPGPDITYDAIRKAQQRGRGFPEPAGMKGIAGAWRLADLVEWKNAKDGVRSPLALVDPDARPGVIYQFNTLDPDAQPPEIEVGYIGQTRQRLSKREDQHRGDKPWSDLIVGSPIIVWQSDACTDTELDARELDAIEELRPRYNYLGQEGAPHAMPLPEQERQRQARQQARGLPPWEPENRYEMSQLPQLSQAGIG